MHRSIRLILTLALLGIAGSVSLFADQSTGPQKQRGFLFEAQFGLANISYDAATDAAFAQSQALGLSRVQVALGATLGYAVSSNLYLTVGVEGYGDRFYESSYYVQLNSYLWEAGIRYYPFTTGLVLGLHAGAATNSVASNLGVSGSSTSPGYGMGVILAYDFGGFTGFGLELGAEADYCTVSGSPITGESLFVAVSWK